MRDISGCLITHEHGDHIKAAKDLVKIGVTVYASAGTLEAGNLKGHRAITVQALQQFQVGTFVILPFDVQHDAKEPLGFLIESTATGEKLLYFTDTYYVKYTFSGLTHIMGEVNYDPEIVGENMRNKVLAPQLAKRLMKSHMSIEHFLDLLKANDLSKVKQIYLLHLSDSNSDEERFRLEVQKLTGTEVYVC